MNVLSKMVDKADMDMMVGFYLYCQNIKLTHSCFANDFLVFIDGKKRSIKGILNVFSDFAKFSGLNIGFEKSTLFMAGVVITIKETILDQFLLIMVRYQ